MAKLGIVTGLRFEARAVRDAARAAGVQDRILTASGLGRAAARRAGETLRAQGATALMSFGIAGGLDPALARGTAVIAAAVLAEDLPPLPCAAPWRAHLAQALARTGPLNEAPLAHAPAVLTSGADKARLFATTGAAAADMESYGVGEAAAGCPFAAVRVIADTADEHLPGIALHAMGPDGSLRLAATLGRILCVPWQLPGLLRLGRTSAQATRRLEALAAAGAPRLFLVEG